MQFDDLDRTVYVKGLSYDSREKDIKYFFEECGEITRINLPMYKDSERNVGYCHVVFAKRRYAKRALDLDGKYLDKRYLKISMAQDMRRGRYGDNYGRGGGDYRGGSSYNDRHSSSRHRQRMSNYREGDRLNTKTVYIRNIPYDTNEDEVANFFERCGDIK